MNRADVVIVGGGFAGLCAARALADGRRRILVLEARTGMDPRFRGELMHPPGVAVLAELGLLEPLERAGGAAVDGFAVVLENGRPPITLPYAEVARGVARGKHGAGPGRGLAMSHHDMVACLRKEIAQTAGVTLRMGVRVTDLISEDGQVRGVRTAAGEEIRAPLTVVAEGRHSKLRRGVGAAEETTLLSFTAALLLEEAELPRAGYGHVFLGTWGPILAYPIGGGKVRMCIDLPVDAGKGQEAVQAFLRDECAESVPEPLRSAMLRALDAQAPEICANHSIQTLRCTAPGVVLVGDSGGCSHPLTATGMTVALNDIRTLAVELDRGPSIDAALARYQHRRYGFVRAREILAEGLYDVFRRGDDGARALRHGLFRYWTSGSRARAASLSLLSGHESRLRAFIAEYFSVVGQTAVSVIGGADDTVIEGGRTSAARGLAKTAYDQLRRTAALVYKDVTQRRAISPRIAELVTPRPQTARKQESAAAAP